MPSRLLSALLNPAVLLALVPLVRLLLETIFGRVFRNSTLEALEKATSNKREKVREVVANEEVRKALAQYVDNAADLEHFFETCFFAGVSLLVWGFTQSTHAWERLVNVTLFFAIIVALVIVGINALRQSYEPGRKDVTKRPVQFAHFLALAIVILEVVSSLTTNKQI